MKKHNGYSAQLRLHQRCINFCQFSNKTRDVTAMVDTRWAIPQFSQVHNHSLVRWQS